MSDHFSGVLFWLALIWMAKVIRRLRSRAPQRVFTAQSAAPCWYYILWLIVPLIKGKIIKYLIIFNGIISVLGAVITYIDLSFPLGTVFGMISYILWNILIIVIMILVLLKYKKH